MADFKLGDLANITRTNGSEATVRIDGVGASPEDCIVTELENDGSAAGPPRRVRRQQLLRIKGPFFDVRGIVYTTSSVYRGEEGEIVPIGRGPKNQVFYHVKFANGATQWFSENEVLIEDK
jgi:hypothetical protein